MNFWPLRKVIYVPGLVDLSRHMLCAIYIVHVVHYFSFWRTFRGKYIPGISDGRNYICSICGRPLYLRLFRSINLFPHILLAILQAEQFSYIENKAESILDSTECKLTNNITMYSYDLTWTQAQFEPTPNVRIATGRLIWKSWYTTRHIYCKQKKKWELMR